MGRLLFKIFAWLVAVIIGLPIVFYLVLLIVNWNDAEPSALVTEFTEQKKNRPAIADADNAYVFAMGFEVAPGDDPVTMGRKRIAWINEATKVPVFDKDSDPLANPLEFRKQRPDADKEFYSSCTSTNHNCAEAYAESDLGSLLARDAWILKRYEALIAHRGWMETASITTDSPFVSLTLVMDAQRLLFAKAMIAAKRGDTVTTRHLLQDDIRFWRMILSSADSLIVKMVAKAALDRHFTVGNLILKTLPGDIAMQAMPDEWRVEITNDERAMQRSLAGEWPMFQASVAMIHDAMLFQKIDGEETDQPKEPTKARRFLAWLATPLFQPQDTLNNMAANLSPAIELSKVPYAQLEKASIADSINRKPQNDSPRINALYNIVGQWLYGIAAPNYGAYAVRLADLEGVRRAALLAVSLRTKNTSDTVANAIAAANLREPYRDKAFTWDGATQDIVFRGLEPGERGEHRLAF